MFFEKNTLNFEKFNLHFSLTLLITSGDSVTLGNVSSGKSVNTNMSFIDRLNAGGIIE